MGTEKCCQEREYKGKKKNLRDFRGGGPRNHGKSYKGGGLETRVSYERGLKWEKESLILGGARREVGSNWNKRGRVHNWDQEIRQKKMGVQEGKPEYSRERENTKKEMGSEKKKWGGYTTIGGRESKSWVFGGKPKRIAKFQPAFGKQTMGGRTSDRGFKKKTQTKKGGKKIHGR